MRIAAQSFAGLRDWGRVARLARGSTLVSFSTSLAAIVLVTTGLLPAATAQEAGYASFARTTILARYQDLEPSITFWRDVMGFEYAGDPEPRTGFASILGWSKQATTYFTSFKSTGGSTVALLLVEDDPDFPTLQLPESGTAYGGIVLVHTAKNIRDVYDRAVQHGVEIIKPYGPSRTGRSIQILLRAPTGHVVEIYELIDAD